MTTQTPKPTRPIPDIDDAWRPFYDGAKRGELMIPRCTACKTWLALAAAICTECLSDKIEWAKASGKGKVFTFALMHQQYHPGFAPEIPYNIAVVELAEGPRINTNLVGIKNGDIKVGMPVVATFEKLNDQVSVPKFKPA